MKTVFESITDRIKVAVSDLQNYSFTEFQKMLPSHINRNLSYSWLNHVFTQQSGITIKDFFYHIKRERAKELLNYYGLNAKEVAFQLGYKRPGRIGVKGNMRMAGNQ